MKKELSPWGRQCKVQMLVLGKSLEQLSRETNFCKTYLQRESNRT